MKNIFILCLILFLTACNFNQSSDHIQQQQQEIILNEISAQIGMPAIKNAREKRLLKDILELRDQTGLVTYTYLWSEVSGKKIFLCNSIGYGIPYATQYTNPQKIEHVPNVGHYIIAQADPNGLFSPASAEGTWVMCKDPNSTQVKPIYIEPKIIVSPFKLNE